MKKLIVIAGPTASGKTSVSIQLAQHFKSEIISSDSRQFFKGMDVGTAKPTKAELAKVPHHFIDFLAIDDPYNIGRFEKDALEKITELHKIHDVLFLVGGSGLYIDAICHGLDDLPDSVPKIRSELNKIYHQSGIEELRRRLQEADPEYYSIVDTNNPHRIIRALEVKIISGKKFSEFRKNTKKERDFQTRKIGLVLDRDDLYNKINDRADQMVKAGLVAEVESLLPFRNENSLQTVGYKEIFDYLDKNISLENAVEHIKQNTRNYAKRQMTYFRKDAEIKWFEPTEIQKMIAYIKSN